MGVQRVEGASRVSNPKMPAMPRTMIAASTRTGIMGSAMRTDTAQKATGGFKAGSFRGYRVNL